MNFHRWSETVDPKRRVTAEKIVNEAGFSQLFIRHETCLSFNLDVLTIYVALGCAETPKDVEVFFSFLTGPDSYYLAGQAPLIEDGIAYI